MSLIRIALLDDYQGVGLEMAPWARLPAHCQVDVFRQPIALAGQAAQLLAGYQVIMALRERTPFPRALLEQLPELRLLATAGRRNAAIDMDAADALGILVCGTAGSGQSTMELTWGLMLAVMRHIPVEAARMRLGGWQQTVGAGLHGKTLGLVGLGNIGGRVARVALAFEMHVLAWSTNLTAERAAECGAERVDKADLLRRSDVVSIHLKLSERTRGLLGSAELSLMKPSAYLINTSRGPVIDEQALLGALREGRIAGAGLDVYDEEPLPTQHPLRGLSNVVLTPHVGYVTDEVYAAFYGETLANIEAWLAGQPTHVLNSEAMATPRPVPKPD